MDSGFYPERGGDGICREAAGGVGAGTVFKREDATIIFILIPVVDSIYRSFFDYRVRNIISGEPGIWNNFANYAKLFSNGKLVPSMINTLVFVFGVVIAQFIFGMALALILNTNMKASRFIRSIMMVPWVVPTIISGQIGRAHV